MHKRPEGFSLSRVIVAAFLAFVMIFSTVPTGAIAEEVTGSESQQTADLVEESASDGAEPFAAPEVQSEPQIVIDEPEEQVEDSVVPQEQVEETVVPQEQTSTPEEEATLTAGDSLDTQSDGADGMAAESDSEVPAKQESPSVVKREDDTATNVHVLYQAYVKNDKWIPEVQDGGFAGKSGQRVEALKARLDLGDTGLTGGIEYRANMQKKGWTAWKRDNNAAGMAGKNLRLEALHIRLYGEVAEKYSVYYCVNAQKLGWMNWAKDGEPAGTVGQNLRLKGIKIVLVAKEDGAAPDSSFVKYNSAFYGGGVVSVQANVQKRGWLKAVGNGKTAGTTKKSLRLEALKISTAGTGIPGSVSMLGNIEGEGWGKTWRNGAVGKAGKGKRLEAVKMLLKGDVADTYDIYYRVYVANLGWLAWAHNGQAAGTKGMSCRMEAVQVRLVPKGTEPTLPSSSTAERYLSGTKIYYRARVQGKGWQSYVKGGKTAGMTDHSKGLQGINMYLDGGTVGGGVSYAAYVSGSGWTSYESAKKNIRGDQVEAIKVKLTGRAKKMYDVYYRAFMTKVGWLGWAKNGERAGAPGTGYRMEAYQVKLVPKGQGAPGLVGNHVVNKAFFEDPMTLKAQGYSSPTNYLIMVDVPRCKLGIYRGSKGSWKKDRGWQVSCGRPGENTVRGVYSVSDRGPYFGHGYTCYWWVRWNGPYLFHSVIYHEGTYSIKDGRLGMHISAGCVRMQIGNAKWIYDHIPNGTTVVTY